MSLHNQFCPILSNSGIYDIKIKELENKLSKNSGGVNQYLYPPVLCGELFEGHASLLLHKSDQHGKVFKCQFL